MIYTAIFRWIGGRYNGIALEGLEEEVTLAVPDGQNTRTAMWAELRRRDLPERKFARIVSIVAERDTLTNIKVAS